MSESENLISYNELAKLVKVGKTTVSDWVDRGIIPSKVGKDGKRKLVRDSAIKAAEKHLTENTQSHKRQVLTSEFNKAKAISETFKAKMARLQYEEKLKQLIRVETVEKRLFELALEVRDAVLTIPNRISPELASMTDEKKINIYLDKILREALTAISKRDLEEFRSKKLK